MGEEGRGGGAKGHGKNQQDSGTGWQHERDVRPFEVSELIVRRGHWWGDTLGGAWDLQRQPDPPTY